MKKYLIPKLYLVKFSLLFFIPFIFLSFSEPHKNFKFISFKGGDSTILSYNSSVEENYQGNEYYCTRVFDSLINPRYSNFSLEFENLTGDTIIYRESRNTGGHFMTLGSLRKKVAPFAKFAILCKYDLYSITGYFGQTVSVIFDNINKNREDMSDYKIFLRIQGIVNAIEK